MYLQVFRKVKFVFKSLSGDYLDLYFGSLGFVSSLTSRLSYLRYYKVSSVIAEGYYSTLNLDTITSSYIQNRYVHSCNSTKWKAKGVITGRSTYILIQHVLPIKKKYVKEKIELYFVIFEAASSSEMSVHFYKIARFHIHEGNKLHILAHSIASLTSANFKTFLL